MPQLGPCGSLGRSWRLQAARHSQSEAQPLGAQPPPRGLKRTAAKVTDFTAFDYVGKIIFESPLVSKTGYYELLDQIETEQPANPDQQYDIFLHIYVATPLGDRRLGFKQFGARQLKADSGWSITPQWFTFTPDFENMQEP